jgi:hypothetical protein
VTLCAAMTRDLRCSFFAFAAAINSRTLVGRLGDPPA